jgi:hypothetical protein
MARLGMRERQEVRFLRCWALDPHIPLSVIFFQETRMMTILILQDITILPTCPAMVRCHTHGPVAGQ